MTGPGHYIALGKTVKDTDNSYRILGPQEKKKKKKKSAVKLIFQSTGVILLMNEKNIKRKENYCNA